MSVPSLTEFAAVAVNAARGNAGAWNALTSTEQATAKGYMRYGLDYLASVHGVTPGDIYSAGPSDPPPTQPPT